MAMNDLLSDFITRIRNAQTARLKETNAPFSNLLANVAEVLKQEGYIEDWAKEGESEKPTIRVALKYHHGTPVIQNIKRVSKPGRRSTSAIGDLPMVKNGLGIYILSTSKGVLSDHNARQHNVGGEVLCEVF